mgnify:CR=1 FL=1
MAKSGRHAATFAWNPCPERPAALRPQCRHPATLPGIRHAATPAGPPAPADVAGNPPRRNAAATPKPLPGMDVAALRQFWAATARVIRRWGRCADLKTWVASWHEPVQQFRSGEGRASRKYLTTDSGRVLSHDKWNQTASSRLKGELQTCISTAL